MKKEISGAAKIGETYYETLQSAINAVPTNNTETTIKLLRNVSENITISKNKNIVLNLQKYTLSDPGSGCVLENSGTVTIQNGTIQSSSITDGAVNNKSTGTLNISGGRIMMIVSGGKQAVYNDKGTVNITGGYLSSNSTLRGTVQNVSGGTMNITGGTIVAEGNQAAVVNAGTMTIGTKDGSVSKTSPLIKGYANGINSTTNFSFYDGIVKGATSAINNTQKITDKEPEYDITNSQETIDGTTYKTMYLAIAEAITFNPNGGTVDETTRSLEKGDKIGPLPVPTWAGHRFDGWFTLAEGGEQINENTIVTGNLTYYAHWTEVMYAEVGGVQYSTIQAAINSIPADNTETVITILEDTNESFTIKSGQNIVLDIQDNTMSTSTDAAVITNNGTISIINGTLTSKAPTNAVINNKSGGRIIVSGGSIVSTGTRSAIYNEAGGIVEISGDSYLSSTATGNPSGSPMERGTVHNLLGGTVTITGGTIVGVNQQALSNQGNMTIGVENDGSVSNTSPVIIGNTSGVKNTGTLNIYDGIIKGKTDSIAGTVSDTEDNSTRVDSTEVIDGTTYQTTYFVLE